MERILTCTPRRLPREKWVEAAQKAVEINPMNHAPVQRLAMIMPGFMPSKERIAVVTTKYWGNQGVKLTVAFLDNPPAPLRKRILSHMNAWNKTGNVEFVETSRDGQVRIARMGGNDGGYWSYVGTDILMIPRNEPTMNLEEFSMSTPISEFHRVVRHETGHTLGFPHEHMRKQLVAKIDPEKAVEFFRRTQGWTAAETRAQVLTPLEDSSILGTPFADPKSIMCYQIPGSITRDGKPIPGGVDIDTSDFAFAGQIYPKAKRSKPTRKRKR